MVSSSKFPLLSDDLRFPSASASPLSNLKKKKEMAEVGASQRVSIWESTAIMGLPHAWPRPLA
jgi:hypothetical protein